MILSFDVYFHLQEHAARAKLPDHDREVSDQGSQSPHLRQPEEPLHARLLLHSRLVWGVFRQGGAPRVLSIFCAGPFYEPQQPLSSVQGRSGSCTFLKRPISLVRPAAQAFPRPDRGTLTPARAEGGQGWRVAPPRRGLSLHGFEHDGRLERVGDDGVRGELRVGARSIVPHPCMRRAKDRDHDAGIRIGSKLRGGGPILSDGMKAMRECGTPPPRTVIGDPSQVCGQGAETVRCSPWLRLRFNVPDGGRRRQARRHRERSAIG